MSLQPYKRRRLVNELFLKVWILKYKKLFIFFNIQSLDSNNSPRKIFRRVCLTLISTLQVEEMVFVNFVFVFVNFEPNILQVEKMVFVNLVIG